MKQKRHTRGWWLTFCVFCWLTPAFSQTSVFASRSVAELAQGATESLVTVAVVKEGKTVPVGAGLLGRSDGVVITAYHLVRGAGDIQIRLPNGEVYDRVPLILSDERRNIAFLRLPLLGLRVQANNYSEEGLVGSRAVAVYLANGVNLEAIECVLSAVVMADELPGAGEGYRALRINRQLPEGVSGVLLNERGVVLGVLVAKPQAYQSYAVPMNGLLGYLATIESQPGTRATVTPSYAITYSPRPAASPTPVPIAQTSVSVPERGVLPLTPKGPGSAVVKPKSRAEVLRESRTIYVKSRTVFFKPYHMVNELNKRAELSEWGLSFVDELETADLVMTLDHVLFTYKFTFSIAHQRTGMNIASGEAIIFDGNLGALKLADRVIDKLARVRAATPPEEKNAGDKSGKPASN